MAAKGNKKVVAEHEHSTCPPLTARNLLDLCSLNGTSTTNKERPREDTTKYERIKVLKTWHQEQPELLSALLLTDKGVDAKSGCFPLHWAAGTGFDEAVQFIADNFTSSYQELEQDSEKNDDYLHLLVNQLARKPSTGRTPLHYAARNGHVNTCQLLIENYNSNSNPKCHRGSVTPLQLAVWQNRLPVVEFLVSVNGRSVVLEKNDFHCGLNHWIGLIPKHRWLSDDGSGVLPLARYLESCGVSYSSTPENQQNQGHTPLHKSAWGGNVALMEYFRCQHNVHDTIQDSCGNYAADLAGMAGNFEAQEWLYQHGSLDREKSCTVLGVDVTATEDEIRARYKHLAKQYHPDRCVKDKFFNSNKDEEDEFMKIKAAYEHLIHEGGVGTQANPKYEALKLLTAAAVCKVKHNDNESTPCHNENKAQQEDREDLFHARILAIISDYGDKGFPISAIAKRWNQIWPDKPFPSPEQYLIEVPIVDPSSVLPGQPKQTTLVPKRVKLLKFLKWKCREVCYFRKVNGVELAFQKVTTSQNHLDNNSTRDSSVFDNNSAIEDRTIAF